MEIIGNRRKKLFSFQNAFASVFCNHICNETIFELFWLKEFFNIKTLKKKVYSFLSLSMHKLHNLLYEKLFFISFMIVEKK